MTAETALPPRPGRPGDPGPPGLALRPGSGRSCLDGGDGSTSFEGSQRGGPARPTPRRPADEGVSVTPPMLRLVFDSALCAALTAWVGSILFFSFGVAPIIFPVLGAEAGGKLVRRLLPALLCPGCDLGVDRPAVVRGGPALLPRVPGQGWRSSADDPGEHPDHALRRQHADAGHQRLSPCRPVGATAVRPVPSPLGPAQRRGPAAGGGPADRLRHPPRARTSGIIACGPGEVSRVGSGGCQTGRPPRWAGLRAGRREGAGIVAGPLSGGPGPKETGVRRVTCRKLVKSRGLGRPIPRPDRAASPGWRGPDPRR